MDIQIKRGGESWSFLYILFGILLTIDTFFLSIINIDLTSKILAFIGTFLLLVWTVLINARAQNKIIGLKIKLEEKYKRL